MLPWPPNHEPNIGWGCVNLWGSGCWEVNFGTLRWICWFGGGIIHNVSKSFHYILGAPNSDRFITGKIENLDLTTKDRKWRPQKSHPHPPMMPCLIFDVAEEQGAALLRKLSMKKVPSQSCLSHVLGAKIQPLWPYKYSQDVAILPHNPDAPCMEYLPTFTPNMAQMQVNIPYMEHLGNCLLLIPMVTNVDGYLQDLGRLKHETHLLSM